MKTLRDDEIEVILKEIFGCVSSDDLWFAQQIRDEIEKRNRWIPVTERLPEKRGWYLVSCVGEDENYVTIWFFNSLDFGIGTEVIAWKELPEPFKD